MLAARETVWPAGFYHDDWQAHGASGYLECGKAFLEGSYPLVSLRSWQGGALANEYVFGVFSPVVMGLSILCASLGLEAHQVPFVFVLVHSVILAWGTYQLGLAYGLEPWLAAFLGCSVPLNGFMVDWAASCWPPILVSTAWLPWVWVSLRRITVQEKDRWAAALAPCFIFLLVTAGWPMTVLMAALVTVWLAAFAWRAIPRLLKAWAIGWLLSTPAWAMLIEGFAGSFRAGMAGTWEPHWTVTPPMWLGIGFPLVVDFANPFQPSFTVPYLWTELFTGFWPPWMLLVGLVILRKNGWGKYGPWWVLLLVCVLLASLPAMQPLRWSFRWLPLFVLAFNLMACLVWQEARRREVLALAAVAAGALASSAIALGQITLGLDASSSWSVSTFKSVALDLAALNALALAAVVWALRRGWPWAELLGLGASLLGLALVAWHGGGTAQELRRHWDLPASSALAQASEMIRDRTALAVVDFSDSSAHYQRMDFRDRVWMQFGNLGMTGQACWVNGYSPSDANGAAKMFGLLWNGVFPDAEAEESSAPLGAQAHGLEALGIDTVVAPAPWFAAWDSAGWVVIAGGPSYQVRGKAEKLPRLRSIDRALEAGRLRDFVISSPRERRWQFPAIERAGRDEFRMAAFAAAEITQIHETRLALTAQVNNPSPHHPALLVSSRPWAPGYRASLDGCPLDVFPASACVVAVMLPPAASGELVIAYRPASLGMGLALTVLGMFLWAWTWRRMTADASRGAG
jgi:hypothetical protein